MVMKLLRPFMGKYWHDKALEPSWRIYKKLPQKSNNFRVVGLHSLHLTKFKLIKSALRAIELKNSKHHGLLPPGGSVSPPSGFASLFIDQGVP